MLGACWLPRAPRPLGRPPRLHSGHAHTWRYAPIRRVEIVAGTGRDRGGRVGGARHCRSRRRCGACPRAQATTPRSKDSRQAYGLTVGDCNRQSLLDFESRGIFFVADVRYLVRCRDGNCALPARSLVSRSPGCPPHARPRGSGGRDVCLGSRLDWQADPGQQGPAFRGTAEVGDGDEVVWFRCHLAKTDTADARSCSRLRYSGTRCRGCSKS